MSHLLPTKDTSPDWVAQRSADLFDQGLHCAESVLQSIAEAHAIDSPLVPGIATGFCSGMARTGGICGALSGGILAINLLKGRSTPDQDIEGNYAMVRQLIDAFEAEFEHTLCPDLLGCDINTRMGKVKFKTRSLHRRCRHFTSTSARLAQQLLLKSG